MKYDFSYFFFYQASIVLHFFEWSFFLHITTYNRWEEIGKCKCDRVWLWWWITYYCLISLKLLLFFYKIPIPYLISSWLFVYSNLNLGIYLIQMVLVCMIDPHLVIRFVLHLIGKLIIVLFDSSEVLLMPKSLIGHILFEFDVSRWYEFWNDGFTGHWISKWQKRYSLIALLAILLIQKIITMSGNP